MGLLLALAPLGLALALILSGRAAIWSAGLIGASLALALAWVDGGGLAAADALARGLWIAWMAISIIVAGLFFQKAALAATPDVFHLAGDAAGQRSRAFVAVFLLGVFVESASGFGLGAVAAAAMLAGSGLPPVRAAALALLSLSLVPWGALAIGTNVAAGLTGLPVAAIGVESAILNAPVLATALVLFWLWAPGGFDPRAMAAEALWVAALLGLLYAANRAGVVDVAGVIAAGALFALRYVIDKARGRPALAAAPFAGFALLIVALRLAPGATPALEAIWTLRPWSDLPGFPPVAHASLWLAVAGACYGLAKGLGAGGLGLAARDTLKAAWIPTAVTAGYVVLGEGMAATGAPAAIAEAVASALGAATGYATPAFAALAGWLTGANAAAHGMLAGLQAALGAAAGDPLASVANQNVVASAYTMLSPMRVALVAAALGIAGQENRVVAKLAPFAVAVLVVGWAATALA